MINWNQGHYVYGYLIGVLTKRTNGLKYLSMRIKCVRHALKARFNN